MGGRPGLRGPRPPLQQAVGATVELGGQQQAGDGGLEVLLLILVTVERLPQLHRYILYRGERPKRNAEAVTEKQFKRNPETTATQGERGQGYSRI